MTTVCVSARVWVCVLACAPACVRPRGTGGACGRASAGPETGVRTVCAGPHERVRQGAATRSATGLELALSTTTGGDGRSQTVRQRYHCVEPRLSLVPHTPSPRGASPAPLRPPETQKSEGRPYPPRCSRLWGVRVRSERGALPPRPDQGDPTDRVPD